MTRLCVVSPGALGSKGGRVEISPKALEGLRSYARLWPGEVVFVARRATKDNTNLGFEWPVMRDLPLDVTITEDLGQDIRRLGRDTVTLLPSDPENAAVVDPLRSVLVADNPSRVRWEFVRTGSTPGRLAKARIGVGLARRARTVGAMIRAAAGIQCNGPLTYAAYVGLSRSAHQYFDTRVTASEVSSACARPPSHDDTLRLGFSGRWLAQKGPDVAVRVTNDLQARGFDVSLLMFGGGPMEDELRAMAKSAVEFVGPLTFHENWVPTVTAAVDVMVLPHKQPDSSSTYSESLACGAPVMAYGNRYWAAFQPQHHGGWATPPNDYASLLGRLEMVAADDSHISRARGCGLRWAQDHTFELEFAARIEHVRRAVDV